MIVPTRWFFKCFAVPASKLLITIHRGQVSSDSTKGNNGEVHMTFVGMQPIRCHENGHMKAFLNCICDKSITSPKLFLGSWSINL